jgi:hypothetical protein
MPIIPLPQRGQPIDVSYLYTIASALNDLTTKVGSSAKNYVTINNGVTSPQTVTISDTKIVSSSVSLNVTGATAGSTKDFTYSFPGEFKFSPVVTATIVNTGTSQVGAASTVALTNITTSKVDGIVRFTTNGDVSVNIHIIAVGVAP